MMFTPLAAIAAAAMLSPRAHRAIDPTPSKQPVITAAALRRACLALFTQDGAGNLTPGLKQICNTAYDGDPRRPLNDANIRAQLDSIPAMGMLLPDSIWAKALGHVQDAEKALILVPREAAGGPTPAFSESGALWSLAQLIADRAQAQADAYLVKRFVSSACSDARMVIPNLCALFASDGALADAIRNPLLIQVAARKDAFVAPLGLLRFQLARNAGAVRAQPDAPIAGEMMMAAITASAQGASFETAVASGISRDMVSLGIAPLTVESAPASANLYLAGLAFASLGQSFASAQHDFANDTLMYVYVRKAVLLNLFLGRPWPSPTHRGVEIWRCAENDAPNCSRTIVDLLLAIASRANQALALATAAVNAAAAKDRPAALAHYDVELLGTVRDLALVNNVASPHFAAVGSVLRAVADSLGAQHMMGVVGALLALPDSLGTRLDLPPTGLRAITLVASLADAQKTSDAVVVLEGFTNGSRTFLDKRNPANGFFVEINAYGGAGLGWEHLLQTSGVRDVSAPYGAIYAPVGVELGWPVDFGFVGSASMFLQAIDLGALTSWRLRSSSDINQDPEVHFAQVFAPGVNVLFGVKGMPLSFGTGISLAPRIRAVTTNGIQTAKNAVRVPLIVVMDVPLFP